MVNRGKNGMLVPQEIIMVADAIQMLLEDPTLKNKLGLRARKTVLERFTWKRVLQEFDELCNKITTETTRGAG